jgi:hypothetical protein
LPAAAKSGEAHTERFWSTGDLAAARRITSKLWGRAVAVDAP